MFESLFTLTIVVAASVYIGVLLGRKNSRSLAKQLVLQERERVRAEVKQEQTQIAADLHGELAKVRDSIIQSAHAYQSVVKTIGDKLAPWDEVQKALQIENPKDIPLLIAEEPVVENKSELAKEAEQSDSEKIQSSTAWSTGGASTNAVNSERGFVRASESRQQETSSTEAATEEMDSEGLLPHRTVAESEAVSDETAATAIVSQAEGDTVTAQADTTEGKPTDSAEPATETTPAVKPERFISSTRSLH
jgi:hypothetical protein